MFLSLLTIQTVIGNYMRIIILFFLLSKSITAMSQPSFSSCIKRFFANASIESNSVEILIENLKQSKQLIADENVKSVFSLSNMKKPTDSPTTQRIFFKFITDPVFGSEFTKGFIIIPRKNYRLDEIAREIEWCIYFDNKESAESYFEKATSLMTLASVKVEQENDNSKFPIRYIGFLSNETEHSFLRDASLILHVDNSTHTYVIRLFLFSNFSLDKNYR